MPPRPPRPASSPPELPPLAEGYPFYSTTRGIGLVDAYHTHPACHIAQSIELRYRQAGHPLEWPECAYCRLHRQAEVRVPKRPKWC